MAENGKWQNRVTEIIRMRVGDLAANKYNISRHLGHQQDKMQAVLEKFGIVTGLVAYYNDDSKLALFDGHLRQKLDPDQEWDIFVTDLTQKEVDELVMYFDQMPGYADIDEAVMTALMQDLADVDGVLGEMLEELAEGVGLAFGGDGDGSEDPGPQLDRAAELQEAWCVKRGDVWEIPSRSVPGKAHRLMCGDSTDAGDVGRLMGNKRAVMVYADAPYGMGLDTDWSDARSALRMLDGKGIKGGNRYERVEGDDQDYDPSPVLQLFPSDEVFLWGADYYAERIPNKNNGSWFVWDKRLDETADRMYGSCFELCWSRRKHKRDIIRIKWAGVFGVEQEPDRRRYHPTQKPVALAAWFIKRFSKANGVVADPYCGVGGSLIACEQTARIGYGMEIHPPYCSVSLDRLQCLGLEPRLVEG